MTSHRPLRHYRRYPRRSRTPRALRWFAAVVLLLLSLLPLLAGCASQSAERARYGALRSGIHIARHSPAARHLRGARFLLGGALLAGLQLPRYCAHFPSGSHRTGVGRFSGHPLACSAGGSAEQPYGNDGLRRCGQCHVRHFMKLSGKYLYEPNSPFRNEEYYIPVLRHVIASPRLGESDKARAKFRLDMALKNRRAMWRRTSPTPLPTALSAAFGG